MKNKEIEVIEKYLNGLISYPFQHKDKEYILSYIEQLEEEIHKKEAMYDSLAVDYRLSQEQNEQLENNIDKALKIIDSYDLGKYDYSIPAEGITELREALKGGSDDTR